MPRLRRTGWCAASAARSTKQNKVFFREVIERVTSVKLGSSDAGDNRVSSVG